jgi:hypothetical protein
VLVTSSCDEAAGLLVPIPTCAETTIGKHISRINRLLIIQMDIGFLK